MPGPEMHRKSWTAAEEEQLLELYRSGSTFHQIAKKLGRSTCSVVNKFQRGRGRNFFRQQKSMTWLNSTKWDADTDAVLLDLAKECKLDFNSVSKKLGRPAKLCMNRYLALQKKESRNDRSKENNSTSACDARWS